MLNDPLRRLRTMPDVPGPMADVPPIRPPVDVVFESAELLVVNKPADLVCHPTKGDEWSSLISRARMHCGPTVEPRLVNRLDRETSGIVLLAKNGAAAGELGRLWETGVVRKTYLAVVHGHLPEGEGCIDAPLGRDEQSRVAIKDCVRPDGAASVTRFRVLRRFERDARPFSLLEVTPETGRKHQIRIHLAHVGHSIVGDKLYGGQEDHYLALVEDRLDAAMRAALLTANQLLHSAGLEFGWNGATYHFSAPPDEEFRRFAGDGSPLAT